jgi:YbbR domain-containing protein
MKRESIQRHFLKIIAAFFAVSLWFYVLNSEPIQVERTLSVNYLLPKGMAIKSFPEKEVVLKIKGSKAFLQNIFTNKEKLNIDLNPYYVSSGNTFKVRFFTNEIAVPFGVDVIDITPKETAIELDKYSEAEISIRVHYIGDSLKDRRIKEVKLEPKSYIVSGPIEVLKNLAYLETTPVNLALMNKDEGSLDITLADIDDRLSFVSRDKLKLKYKTVQVKQSGKNL